MKIATIGSVTVIETRPYRVSRLRLAYVAAEEYIRTFWFFLVSVPLGGLFLLTTGERVMQGIGMFALLWPATIPGRALLISGKASRLFMGGAVMRLTDSEVEFLGETPGKSGKRPRMAIPLPMVRDAVMRQQMLIVRTYRQAFAPIDPEAFASEEDRQAFWEAINGEPDASDSPEASPDAHSPSNPPSPE